jgi:type 1 glutamine amidotransferase
MTYCNDGFGLHLEDTMRMRLSPAALAAGICAAVLVAGTAAGMAGQTAPQGRGGTGRGGGAAAVVFTAADANKDAALTRDELRGAFEKWFSAAEGAAAGQVTQAQLAAAVAAAFAAAPALPPAGAGRGAQNQTPDPGDVEKMMAALPARAPAKPKQPRRVLVLARAAGFVHSSIPLAARTVEELGKKTGAWSTTITYDAADINETNLKQYDAIFLASTTSEFLDDPADAAATAARRKAMLDFVRNGKGVAGIHAATDSYHRNRAAAATPGRAGGPAGGGRGPGGGRGGPAGGLATQMVAQGDKNNDQNLTREEIAALAEAWFDRMDSAKAGRVTQQAFPQHYAALMPPAPAPAAPRLGPTGFPIQAPAKELGPDTVTGTWPEWNRMIGGFFKFHWNDGQVITVKLDDPSHPLNAPFKGQPFEVMDEIYTYGREVYSRENLRVLTSVDYSKMSAEDKAKEQFPRPDGDYALSWVRRDGKGRVFYEALGHSERIYAIAPILEHVLAGIQYVIGDLPADDAPSAKAGKK